MSDLLESSNHRLWLFLFSEIEACFNQLSFKEEELDNTKAKTKNFSLFISFGKENMLQLEEEYSF